MSFLPSTFLNSFLPPSLPSSFPPFLPPFFPSSLPAFLRPSFPPSRLPFLPSSLPAYLPTSLPPYLPTFPPFLPSSLPPFLPSFLPSFFPSFLPSPHHHHHHHHHHHQHRLSSKSPRLACSSSSVSPFLFLPSFLPSFLAPSFLSSFLPPSITSAPPLCWCRWRRRCRDVIIIPAAASSAPSSSSVVHCAMTSNNLFVSLLRLGMVPAGPALSEILRAHAQQAVYAQQREKWARHAQRHGAPMVWPARKCRYVCGHYSAYKLQNGCKPKRKSMWQHRFCRRFDQVDPLQWNKLKAIELWYLSR